MKIDLENETVSIPLAELANEIYNCGQYLKHNFSAEDLTEKGTDFAGTDCRLNVRDGSWSLLTGDSQYDQDHRGYWACSSIRRGCTWNEAREIARDLVRDLS
jgi:hypothetical protein